MLCWLKQCTIYSDWVAHQQRAEYARLLLTQSTPFLSLATDDYTRAVEILSAYQDVPLDFVDCCITALTERMNITRICTFDRRDFMIIRPSHTDYFELLP